MSVCSINEFFRWLAPSNNKSTQLVSVCSYHKSVLFNQEVLSYVINNAGQTQVDMMTVGGKQLEVAGNHVRHVGTVCL